MVVQPVQPIDLGGDHCARFDEVLSLTLARLPVLGVPGPFFVFEDVVFDHGLRPSVSRVLGFCQQCIAARGCDNFSGLVLVVVGRRVSLVDMPEAFFSD